MLTTAPLGAEYFLSCLQGITFRCWYRGKSGKAIIHSRIINLDTLGRTQRGVDVFA